MHFYNGAKELKERLWILQVREVEADFVMKMTPKAQKHGF